MANSKISPRIFISVAEQSADEHAASLVRAFRETHPGATFHGLAGPRLQAEGAECFFDMTARSAMAHAAFGRIPEVLGLLRRLKTYLREGRFDAAVLVDSPALNLPIAKICRRNGIPVLYYIAPQTWAWGPRAWRNNRVRRRVNRLACLWAFEEPYFRAAGIQATYVGHPTLDHLRNVEISDARIAELRSPGSPVITLLPGSRKHVVEEVFPGQLEIARALRGRFNRINVIVVAANEEAKGIIQHNLSRHDRRLDATVVSGEHDRAAAIRAADLCLAASGTVTLEVAYWGTPMLVMYQTPKWRYLLVGRWLIHTPYLSLPNILAGREIVPEFMPYYDSTGPIAARALEWLSNPGTLIRVRTELAEMIQGVLKPDAARNAASELAKLLAESTPI
ncbi:MAG TPA: lipid-A-disaccharide synthase [Phycisphaerae bacterium]|nr:lipid-A-disaccharide synthase [Phycisphaerae bacterium]